MEGEEEPWWPPLGDKDVATSPRGHGMKLEAPGIYTGASCLPPHPDGETSQAELPEVPFCPQICHVTVTRPRVWGRSRSGHPTPLAAGEEEVGKVHSRLAGSCPSRSAAFGDHLPVPLLLLHQPGGEEGGGLRDPFKRDLPKPRGGDTHLRLRTSVSSMSRSWAARSSSSRCW